MSCWWNITWNFFSLKNKMRCHKNSEDCKNLAKKFHVLANYKLPLAPSLQGQFHLKSSWNFKNNVLYLYKVQISSTKLASSTLTESWFGSTFCTVSLKLFLHNIPILTLYTLYDHFSDCFWRLIFLSKRVMYYNSVSKKDPEQVINSSIYSFLLLCHHWRT